MFPVSVDSVLEGLRFFFCDEVYSALFFPMNTLLIQNISGVNEEKS